MPRVIHLLILTIVKTLLLYAVIITGLNFVKFGGEPMIERLVSVKETRGLSFSDIRFKEAERIQDVDILFLGASHTLGGFDPRIFARLGYKTMNLGSSSQTPMNTMALLERHLQHLRPKLVIYEIYQAALGLDGVESFHDIVKNSRVDLASVKMAWNVHQPQAWAVLLSAGLRRAPGYDTIPDGLHRAKNGWNVQYVRGGYVENKGTIPPERLHKMRMGLPRADHPIDPCQLSYLEACIECSRKHGAAFAACSYPIPAETRKALVLYDEKQRVIADALKRKSVPFKDFNEEITLETAIHYYDEVHLNQAGVEVFNPALLEWLKQENLLPKPSREDLSTD